MGSESLIRSPEDLKRLSLEELHILAEEIRQKILSTCLKNGGHLGASLGAVEIAIALHVVFESPREPMVWDVGHQAYAHKILTGRWDRFESLRLQDGLSGFLNRNESEHDVFGAGHSSTALSAALAMAWARGQNRSENWTTAILGDGGLTAGLAFEALNCVHEGGAGPLLVILNDNQMSISQNSGALPAILGRGEAETLFRLYGFDYAGPLDGHDLNTLIGTLRGIKQGYQGKPVLLHVITQKGKGYFPAEERPDIYHGVSPVQEKAPGQAGGGAPARSKSFSDAFGEAMCRLAEKNPAVVAITAAMSEGTGLSEFARRFPERFFDVGIAEQHAVTFAAGLATQGFRPVVAIYSTFLQRALDSVIHDVALQNLGVIFAIDRAGVVGADGPTHHGAFDIAYLGMIPGMTLSAPVCLSDLDLCLENALARTGPCAIRYPRGTGPESVEAPVEKPGLRWLKVAKTPKIIVIAPGTAALRAFQSIQMLGHEGAEVTLVAPLWLKPLPQVLKEHLLAHSEVPVVTIEDGAIHGGFGQSMIAGLPRSGRVETLGYGDHFIPHGSPSSLEDREGLSAQAIAATLRRILRES